MRLSVKEGDPGYDPVKAINAKVLVDGKPLDLCIMADEEKGIAEYYVEDDTGRCCVKANRVKGDVKIIFESKENQND